jgi:L-malate glycosyltransferase
MRSIEHSKGQSIDLLHVISGDLWAGAEAQVYYTLSDLQARQIIKFTVVLFNNGILQQRLNEQGIETIVIDEQQHDALALVVGLRRLLVSNKPPILHVHAFKEHILGYFANVLALGRSTMVRTFHGMSEVPSGLRGLRAWKSRAVHRIEKSLLKQGANSHIIAVSKDLEHYLSREYPQAVVTQIYNGIPTRDPREIGRHEIRKEFGVAEDRLWIGTVARLVEPKNLGLLIDAGCELRRTGIPFKISIFGDGPLRPQLQQKIAQEQLQNHIALEGFKKNIHAILASFDLFVLCSLHEGLPISLLEAISLGVPVIGTNVGGIKEVITHMQSGLLVQNNDLQGLVESIKLLKADEILRRELGENAKNHFEREFTIIRTNEKLVELYNGILGYH